MCNASESLRHFGTCANLDPRVGLNECHDTEKNGNVMLTCQNVNFCQDVKI